MSSCKIAYRNGSMTLVYDDADQQPTHLATDGETEHSSIKKFSNKSMEGLYTVAHLLSGNGNYVTPSRRGGAS